MLIEDVRIEFMTGLEKVWQDTAELIDPLEVRLQELRASIETVEASAEAAVEKARRNKEENRASWTAARAERDELRRRAAAQE